jgi:hypothetical protein
MDPGDTGELPERRKQGTAKRDDRSSRSCDDGNVKAVLTHEDERTRHVRGANCISSSSDDDDDDDDDENELQYNYNKELKFYTENYPLDKRMNSDDSTEVSDNDSGEMKYLSKPPKPTRSGRIPQRKKRSQIEDGITPGNERKRVSSSLVRSKKVPKPCTENKLLPLEDLTNVEPGSLVVIATQSPTNPGHHVYKVFMVAPKAAGVPSSAPTKPPVAVPLSPTLLQSVTSNVPDRQLCGESQSAGD